MAGRSGFTLSEGDIFGRGLVEKQKLAVKGKGKSIPGGEGETGAKAPSCSVLGVFENQEGQRGWGGVRWGR